MLTSCADWAMIAVSQDRQCVFSLKTNVSYLLQTEPPLEKCGTAGAKTYLPMSPQRVQLERQGAAAIPPTAL